MSKISIGCFGVRTFTTLWYFSDGHGAQWADTKCWLMTGARIPLLVSSVGGSFEDLCQDYYFDRVRLKRKGAYFSEIP